MFKVCMFSDFVLYICIECKDKCRVRYNSGNVEFRKVCLLFYRRECGKYNVLFNRCSE